MALSGDGLGRAYAFFSDTYEIEHVIELFREEIRAGLHGEITYLADNVTRTLQQYVRDMGDESDYSLFMECQTCSDVIHMLDFFRFDGSRMAAKSLSVLYFLNDYYAPKEALENQRHYFEILDELENNLKLTLLYKLQVSSIRGAILGGKKKKGKKPYAIIFALESLVKKRKGNLTLNEAWSYFENNEFRARNQNGDEALVYIDLDNKGVEKIFQSISSSKGVTDKGLTKSSLKTYLTKAKAKFNAERENSK